MKIIVLQISDRTTQDPIGTEVDIEFVETDPLAEDVFFLKPLEAEELPPDNEQVVHFFLPYLICEKIAFHITNIVLQL